MRRGDNELGRCWCCVKYTGALLSRSVGALSLINPRRNGQMVRGGSALHLAWTGNSTENCVDIKRHRWIRMKESQSRAARCLAIAGMMGVLASSGCKKADTTAPSADSVSTSQPQLVTEDLPRVLERSSIKWQRNSRSPREISIWDTNSGPSVAPSSARVTH